MNKIFKHKRGASGLKVVCEFAKSHCSSGEKTAVNSGAHVSIRSGFKSLSIALISALTLGIATPAMAVNGTGGGSQSEYAYIRGSQATGTNALAIGKDAKAVGYEKNTAYGSDAEASGGGWNLAIGSNAKAIANGYLNRGNAIAIGSDTQATGQRAMAIGANAEATQGQGVAIGSGTKSIGAQSTAIGNDVVATGMSAIAIGNDDIWNGGATDSNNKLLGYERQVFTDEELKDPKIVEALDAMCRKEDCPNSFGLEKVGSGASAYYRKTGVNFMHWSPTLSAGLGSIVIGSRSVAIGKGSTAIGTLTVATGDESTAIGTLSKATASKAIAIGRDSIANMENSVALGVSSKTDYAGIKTKAYVPSLGYVMPMANSVGVISVGSSNQQRRIVNLAPGALDTDAVNVSQLKSLAESLGMDGINDSADKMMRYLSIEKATGEAATLQALLAKEKAFKTYAELRKMQDMMDLNEKATGGTYDPSEKSKINNQIATLEGQYGDFKAKITTPTNLGSITTNSSEAEVKALTDTINDYTKTNHFALTQDQKDALKQKNATNEGATGADAIAIGYSAKSTGAQAVSLGKTATASGENAIAIGNGAKTKENAANAIAIGKSSNATDINTIAIGNNAKANEKSSINIGEGVAADNVLGANSVLIGSAFSDIAKTNTSLKITSSTIAGTDLKIEGKTIDKSVIIGSRHEIGQEPATTTTNTLSQNVIVGEKIRLDNSDQAVTIGSDIIAKNSKGGIAIGGDDADLVGGGYPKTEIQGKGAIAIGVSAKAMKDAAMSLGVNSQTTVAQGVALGFNSVASTDKGSVGLEFDTATNTLKTSSKDNKTWKSTAAALSIGSGTVSRQITNVAAGSEDTDAVNVAQLKSVSDALKTAIGATSTGNYSLDFSGDRGAKITRDKTSRELKIKGGATATADLSTGNIGVEANGDTLNIKLAKALTGLTSAEFKNTDGDTTTITGDKITINPNGNTEDNKKVSIGKDGISAGGKTISNVGKAQNGTDAVNMEQAESIAKDAVKNKLRAGTNVTITPDTTTGEVTISATDKDTKTTVVKGDGIEVTGGNESGDTKTYTVSLDQDTKDKLASIDTISSTVNSAMQNFKVAVGSTEATIGKDDKLNFAADNNLEVKLSDKTVTYKMKDGVQFNDITAGKNGTNGTDGKVSVNGKDGSSVVINGKDGSIGLTGKPGVDGTSPKADIKVAKGEDGTTRIIYETPKKGGAQGVDKHEVATLDDGLKFGGNTGNLASKKLNETFFIKGSNANDSKNWSTDFDGGQNIMTQIEDGNLRVALAKALKGLTSAEFTNATGDTTTITGDKITINPNGNTEDNKKVSLGKDGISAGGKTISNVGEAQNANDAVNKGQLDAEIKKNVAANGISALKFSGDRGNTNAVNSEIKFAGGQTDDKKLSDKPNIGVVAKDGKLNIKLAKDIDVDSVTAKDKITVGEGANKITIADGKITGITSAVDPNGDLAKKLADINSDTSITDAKKAADKKAAIQAALGNVDNGSVATVGDLKNVTNGLDSVVENITNNVTSITNNVTNITNMVVNPNDKKTIDKASEAFDEYKKDPNNKNKQKDAENAIKANKIKTYNPYETTVKNNTTIVEAIQNMNERGIKFIHVSDSDKVGEGDDVTLVSDDSRANQKGSIGIGMNAISDGKNSIAMGTGAQAMGKNTISIGTGNKVIGRNSGAIGDPSHINADDTYAMGNNNNIVGGNQTKAKDIFALGNNIGSEKNPITQAANGSVILGSKGYSNVENGVALGYGSNASVKKGEVGYDITNANHDNDTDGVWKSTESAVSVGNVDNVEKKITRQITSVAAGTKDTDAVNVAQLKAVANQITAVTTNNGVTTSDQTFNPKTGRQVSYNPTYAPKVTNTGVNSVAIGANSVANRANTVSVGSAGNERIIANVADGVAPTDAANMRQLQSVANMVGEVKKDAMAGTASAMAIGNLPQATIPGKGMMAIGAGYYKGQTATALGVSKMSENGRWVFKASASYDSQRNVGAAGAVGFHF